MKTMNSFNKQIFCLIIVAVVFVLFFPNSSHAVSTDKDFNVKNGVLISYAGHDENVIIPDSINGEIVSVIGAGAFAKNKFIESIKMPDSVTVIGANAFENCENLTSVELSSSLKSIDAWAFGYCCKITDISLPNELETIGAAAFYGCAALKEITIPDSVKSIDTHSFRDCVALENVVLSNNIKTLTYRLFSGCSALMSLKIPDSVTEINDECFYKAGIETIVLGANLQSIGNRAFYGCERLASISYNDSLKTVGEEAFAECIRLDKIVFPEVFQSIGTKAFSGCYSIRTVFFGGTKDIGDQAFYGCSKLHTVYLSPLTEKIGKDAFDGCYSLVEVFNSSSLSITKQSDDYGKIARYAMMVHQSGDEDAILDVVDDYMFMTINEVNYLVGYLGDSLNLYFPDDYRGETYNIAEYAFCEKSGVRQVYIPNGVSRIDNFAFFNCNTLTWVRIPKSIMFIGDSAFNGCSALKRISYDGTKDGWSNITIGSGNLALANIYITYAQEITQETEKKALGKRITSSLADLFDNLSNSVFFVNFILTLFWASILLYLPKNRETNEEKTRKRKLFVILCCVQWVIISGFRADSIGADTENYMRLFDLHNSMSWREIIENAKEYYLGNGSYNDYEIGYVVLEKIIGGVTSSHTIYNILVAGIFMSSLGRFIYKYSNDPLISFILYDAFMYNMFSLTGNRQVISVAIGILCGYEFIRKRKFIPFLIIVLVSSLFHRSTLVFIVFYFLANKKITQCYLLTAFAMVGALIATRSRVFNYVKFIVGYDQYTGTYGFAQRTFFILLIILTFAVIVCKSQIFNYAHEAGIQNIDHYLNALILTWFMFPFAMVSPTSMRLVYDFGFISFLLLIPVLAKSFHKRNDRVIIYGSLVLMLGYFISTKSSDYMFFWQM